MSKKTPARQLDREIRRALSARAYPMERRDSWYSDSDYEARGGKIVMMSPAAFLSRTRPLKIDEASRDNIDDLKRLILADVRSILSKSTQTARRMAGTERMLPRSLGSGKFQLWCGPMESASLEVKMGDTTVPATSQR